MDESGNWSLWESVKTSDGWIDEKRTASLESSILIFQIISDSKTVPEQKLLLLLDIFCHLPADVICILI